VNKLCEETFGVQLNGEIPKKEQRKIKPKKSYDYAGVDINSARTLDFEMPTVSINPAVYHNFTISDLEQALGTMNAVVHTTNE
jgi:sortase (surface protein transpeptidase)